MPGIPFVAGNPMLVAASACLADVLEDGGQDARPSGGVSLWDVRGTGYDGGYSVIFQLTRNAE